jgi:hypothetical protein
VLVALVSVAQAQGGDGTPHFWPADAAPGLGGPTPDELLGFRFGASRRSVERACGRAGHDWKAIRGGDLLCTGAAAPRDLPAQLVLRFCDGRLCEARASIAEPSTRVATYARALRSLRAAFGRPPQRRLRVDHQCLGLLVAGRSDRCLTAEGAGVRHWWEVGGTEIFLALEHRPEGRRFEVAYRTAERLTAISRTSD